MLLSNVLLSLCYLLHIAILNIVAVLSTVLDLLSSCSAKNIEILCCVLVTLCTKLEMPLVFARGEGRPVAKTRGSKSLKSG